jgi:hypothetical protein
MCVHARFLLSVLGTDTHTPNGIEGGEYHNMLAYWCVNECSVAYLRICVFACLRVYAFASYGVFACLRTRVLVLAIAIVGLHLHASHVSCRAVSDCNAAHAYRVVA